MNVTYKDLCISIINSETDEICQRIHMILQHIEEADHHVYGCRGAQSRGVAVLCDKLELEARVFNHLTTRIEDD